MELGEVIAVRTLYFVDAPDDKVVVKLGKPQQTPGEEDFCCPYQVIGIGSENVHGLCGVDAFQALELTIAFIGGELERWNRQNGNRLRWKADESGSLGFPLHEWGVE